MSEKLGPKNDPHKPNGPYYPVGDLGGERCKHDQEPWPCSTVRERSDNAATENLNA